MGSWRDWVRHWSCVSYEDLLVPGTAPLTHRNSRDISSLSTSRARVSNLSCRASYCIFSLLWSFSQRFWGSGASAIDYRDSSSFQFSIGSASTHPHIIASDLNSYTHLRRAVDGRPLGWGKRFGTQSLQMDNRVDCCRGAVSELDAVRLKCAFGGSAA